MYNFITIRVKPMLTPAESAAWCDRDFIIGGDGVIFGMPVDETVAMAKKKNKSSSKDLLRQYRGDMDAAQSAYYRRRIQEEEETKVIASWDTIATFLPVDCASQAIAAGGKGGGVPVDKTVARRLKMVAQACVPSGCDAGSLRVLDIRCGDGAAVPYTCGRSSLHTRISQNEKNTIPFIKCDISILTEFFMCSCV